VPGGGAARGDDDQEVAKPRATSIERPNAVSASQSFSTSGV